MEAYDTAWKYSSTRRGEERTESRSHHRSSRSPERPQPSRVHSSHRKSSQSPHGSTRSHSSRRSHRSSDHSSHSSSGTSPTRKVNFATANVQRTHNRPPSRSHANTEACYLCGKAGHRQKDCWQSPANGRKPRPPSPQRKHGPSPRGNPKRFQDKGRSGRKPSENTSR